MTPIVLGWIAAVSVVLVLVARPWKSPAHRSPLALLPAFAAAAWVIVTGATAYDNLMKDGSWTAASVAIGFVPAKAVVYAVLAYVLGRTLRAAPASSGPPAQRWAVPAVLAAVMIYFIGSDVARLRVDAAERHAANETLTAAEVAALTEDIRNGTASKGVQGAFLGNPLCPLDVLEQFAAAPDHYWRQAVARNERISPEIADKLSRDPKEEVRYMLAFNRTLPPEILSRMSRDQSELVRGQVAWTKTLPDEDLARLADDPSVEVRSTVARQQRLSKDILEKLSNDPDERVRNAAWRGG
jgi:hypothetical protein